MTKAIEFKSLAALIDELITTSIKCFIAQDEIREAEIRGDMYGVAKHAIDAQHLNARRGALIRAIDGRMGEADITQMEKTYG